MNKEVNMEGVILTHLSGSKATQEDVFPIDNFEDIIIGRDQWSHVVFGETETMVGRQHAKITQHPDDPTQFFITDLKSRNGTYLNQHRIFGKVRLKPGDIVQCGFGGPEFRFSVEPETDRLNAANMPLPTVNLLKYPSVELAEQNPPPVESSDAPLAPVSETPVAPAAAADEESVDYSTPPPKGRLGTGAVVGSGVLMGIIALGTGFVVYRNFKSIDASSGSTAQPDSVPTPLPSPSAVDTQSPGTAVVPTVTAAPAAVKPPATTVRRTPRAVVIRRPVRPPVDPKEAAKRLKKEQKRREKAAKEAKEAKESKKSKSKY
jgi:hypothetical protein